MRIAEYGKGGEAMQITDDDILTADKVSTEMAAKYLGTDTQYVRLGLQQNRLIYGNAVLNPGGRWSYHISPGLLVAYKRGTLALVMRPEYEPVAEKCG